MTKILIDPHDHPEPHTMKWTQAEMDYINNRVENAVRQALEQAQQVAPVAIKTMSKIGKAVGYWRADLVPPHIGPDSHDITPLYTTPPPRQPWVGLTDEQVFCIWRRHTDLDAVRHTPDEDDGLSFARAIEAKLKEKNT